MRCGGINCGRGDRSAGESRSGIPRNRGDRRAIEWVKVMPPAMRRVTNVFNIVNDFTPWPDRRPVCGISACGVLRERARLRKSAYLALLLMVRLQDD